MRIAKRLLLVALTCVSVFTVVTGQAVKGSLLGTITDSNGAAASGATITITETRTNISATTATNADGNYVFTNVKDGVYRIEATQKGFKKVVREGVIVDVNTTVRVDMALQVGEVSEQITIQADVAPLLQTDRADTGRLLESKQVAELPLGFNRNFQSLLVTVPGATRPSRPHSEFFNPQDSLESKVNGQSRLSNNFQIEGVDDNHRTGLLTILIPAADAIETVSISTSNFDAEFGRAGGAVSNVTLKSGTNDIHGSAFFFGNNENTRAKPYFSSQTPNFRNPFTRYRQYGFTLGGPIIKNKLFYFGDYQRTIDKLGKSNFHTIPIPEWRTGDFRNAPTRIYDPATGNPDGSGRQQISCNGVLNVICPNRISPISTKLLGFLPPPNITAALGQNNYVVNTTREKTIHSFDVKMNYQLNESNVITGRLSFQRPEIFDPGSYGVYGGPANGAFAGTGTQDTYSVQGTWTHTFSPRLLMDVRVGVNYYHNVAVSQAAGLKTSEEVGIKNVNTDSFTDGLSRIEIGGFSSPMLGFSNSLPWDRGETTTNITGIVTKLFGNHTLKVGGEWRRNRDFLLQIQDAGGVRGRFGFGSQGTGLAATPGGQAADQAANSAPANAFAAFLLDLPNNVSRDIKIIDNPGTRHRAFFSFVNDKWQVTQKLTLDLGLRHEYYRPFTGIAEKGGLSNYDPANNTARVAGFGDIPDDLGVTATWKNFAPRLGAAYRFTDKTVVRAGFGTTIIPFPNNSYAFNFPVKQTNVFQPTNSNSFLTAGSMAAGFPAPTVFAVPSNGIIDANLAILRTSRLFSVPTDLREGKIHSWNAAFQRELWWGITAEAAYVGNVGRGIVTFHNLNASLDPNAARPDRPGNNNRVNDDAGRPLFQKFGRTAETTTWIPLDSNYHSLQVKADKRFSKGFLLTTSYTYGRALNYANDEGTLSTPANPELAYGRAEFDRTHMFSQTVVWELPFARQSRGIVRALLDGWQLSGLLVAQTGTPIDFTFSGTTLHAPGNTQRPNASGRPEVFGKFGPGALYFDPSVFSAPVADAQGFAPFGNLKRNASINGPGYVNLDGSIFKRFRFTERIGGELRADVFNVTNSPHFNNPNGGYVVPPAGQTFPFAGNTFGQVTGAFGERLVRFGARVTF